MNIQRIEVMPLHQDLSRRIEDVSKITRGSVYKIKSERAIAREILSEVFGDPILVSLNFDDNGCESKYVCEINFRPGVTDNSALSAKEGLKLLGIDAEVASGTLYFMDGEIEFSRLEKISKERLANQLIQEVSFFENTDFVGSNRFEKVVFPEVNIDHKPEALEINLDISDDELKELSRTRCLALTLSEMKHIQTHFLEKGRKPTDVELEVLAQTWSEHCKHKIFAAKIDFQGETVDSLYKTYIKDITENIRSRRNLSWLISVFKDNAGVVRFDENIDQCIKVETHNSPSALDPFGGAITGILGVNRDILGVGMGGFPVANTDVFCFGEMDQLDLPSELKSPALIMDGVHRGVEDGGNKSGIPTVNGAMYFDKSFAGKPLVFVGTVGVMPQKLNDGTDGASKNPNVGDRIVMIGGAIGCDGIHGATFSSMELNEDSPVSAVQIGDPLMQKRVTDFLRVAQDRILYSAITDNGAGGLSSSVGEMATLTGGADLHLDRCPVKYPGLSPYELFISESQERMTLAVPNSKWQEFKEFADSIGVEASSIGTFNDSGTLAVYYNGKMVADLDLHFMHDSLPQMELTACWSAPEININNSKNDFDYDSTIIDLLKRPNVASKESLVRRYDHEVQAATCVKPFTDKNGPNDSGVIWLYPHGGHQNNGIAIGCGMNPRMSKYEPELMAKMAVDEAIRNVVITGGDLDTCCLVDNFCWPDPIKTKQNLDGDYKLGQLVKSCQGLASICETYGTPLVSGKDSMKNDYRGAVTISVLPTLLITAMAKTDCRHLVSSDFKNSGDLIYLIGKKCRGLLASEFAELNPSEYKLPELDPEANVVTYREYRDATRKDLINSGHDISDGGLAIAICESMIGGDLGALLDNDMDHDQLFNEGGGRFVVTVSPFNKDKFEQFFTNCNYIGKVTSSRKLKVGSTVNLQLDNIDQAWKERFNVNA